jgi:hypothetical protein
MDSLNNLGDICIPILTPSFEDLDPATRKTAALAKMVVGSSSRGQKRILLTVGGPRPLPLSDPSCLPSSQATSTQDG